MIDAGRPAGRAEVFVRDADLVQCTFEEFNALRNMIRHTEGVSFFSAYDHEHSGHRIVRDFPVPSITTLPEVPHGEHVPRAR